MAKATADTQGRGGTPSTTTPLKTIGRFTFALEEGVSIPADRPRRPSAIELPFKDFFGHMEPGTCFFVPSAFWTAPVAEGGRGAKPEVAARSGYAREKLRGAFKLWRERDPQGRADLELVIVARAAGEEDGRFTEPGLSVFMRRRAVAGEG